MSETRSFSGWSCPRCGDAALSASDDAYGCERCGTRYPLVGSLPCLALDPDQYRTLWGGRLERYRAVIHARAATLDLEAARPHLLERTRDRVRKVSAALRADLAVMGDLFEPLLPRVRGPSLLEETTGGVSPVLGCYEHLHRDWVWGEKENAAALDIVRSLAPAPGQRTVVLGVGTGRLALDIQRELRPAFTLGIDHNPLPLLAFDALLGGRSLELHEYPIAPHSAEEVAIPRRLVLPFPAPEGLHVALADALTPPLAPGSVDLVVTPWLIDVIGVDVRVTCRAVARLLPPGGIWANFCPLRFAGSVSSSLSVDEVHELVEAAGFELVQRFRRDVPYFDSAHSGSRRTETVFAFAARRTERMLDLPVPDGPAPWLDNTTLPIPMSPALASEGTRAVVTAGVLSMVDGNRSIRDVARMLATEWRTDPSRLEGQLVTLFSRLVTSS
jgi:hypothetical protein